MDESTHEMQDLGAPEPEPEDGGLFAPGSMRVVVYSAMLSATMAGQFLGIGADALLGWRGGRGLVLPVMCSVVLEALAGARLGARSAGGPLDTRQSAHIAGMYSLALLALSVPLAAWLSVSHPALPGNPHIWSPTVVLVVLAVLAVATLARWGMMLVFTPRTRG